MKKHSMAEHVEAVSFVYFGAERFMAGGRDASKTIWFTAYERWLNDRPLMTEEDKP